MVLSARVESAGGRVGVVLKAAYGLWVRTLIQEGFWGISWKRIEVILSKETGSLRQCTKARGAMEAVL